MTEFERELVQSFNDFFEKNRVNGIAYRLKQHRFTSQVLDILVDSPIKDYYLGIECKSISTEKGTNTLYFTQHFSKKREHQVERIARFLEKSGRKGLLAVELRQGSGHAREAHIIPWNILIKKYREEVGYTLEEIRGFPEIGRSGKGYIIDPKAWRNISVPR